MVALVALLQQCHKDTNATAKNKRFIGSFDDFAQSMKLTFRSPPPRDHKPCGSGLETGSERFTPRPGAPSMFADQGGKRHQPDCGKPGGSILQRFFGGGRPGLAQQPISRIETGKPSEHKQDLVEVDGQLERIIPIHRRYVISSHQHR
jgi:hypothetical protein